VGGAGVFSGSVVPGGARRAKIEPR
jgi:hypothetical protein